MIGILRKIFASKWTAIIGIAIAVWQGYLILKPRPLPPDELQRELIDDLVWDITEQLPNELDDIESIAILPFGGVEQGPFVSEALTKSMRRAGDFKVRDQSLVDRIMRELGIEQAPVADLNEALRAGHAMGVDAVVFGTLERFKRKKDFASARLELMVADVNADRNVYAESFKRRQDVISLNPADFLDNIRRSPFLNRTIVWLLFTLLFPAVLFPFINRLLALESNLVNFLTVLILSLTSFCFAYFLMGFSASGFFEWVFLLVALGLSFVYNYFICSKLEDLRT
jgi:hypothetical protein